MCCFVRGVLRETREESVGQHPTCLLGFALGLFFVQMTHTWVQLLRLETQAAGWPTLRADLMEARARFVKTCTEVLTDQRLKEEPTKPTTSAFEACLHVTYGI